MNYLVNNSRCIKRYVTFLVIILLELGIPSNAVTQEKSRYLLGEDNELEMDVHIIGEVQKPGKYRVRDNTNVMELISEAGGPTQFSDLSKVTITQAVLSSSEDNQIKTTYSTKNTRIIRYNINDYLKKDNVPPPPLLKPGDVVLVPKNKWNTWKNIAGIMRDISVVASAYFLYLRASRD